MSGLVEFDMRHVSRFSSFVIGVDEVGRGCIAGPVVACACMLDVNKFVCDGIADSKSIKSEKRRQCISDSISSSDCVKFSFGYSSPQEVDSLNVLHASLLAMSRALSSLGNVKGVLIIDGIFTPVVPDTIDCLGVVAVPKGDSKSRAVAAASILAKVKRDCMMNDLDDALPGYGFRNHKGYPTKEHVSALFRYGVTSEHRRSFSPVKSAIECFGSK